MRATDIIRQVLNMIDAIEANAAQGKVVEPEINVEISTGTDDEIARMKQIAGLIGSTETQYSNEPQEKIAGIESVTTDAGGGVNGPKDIADIKSSTVAMYPGTVFGAK
jgi:hypothetical protein